MKSLAMYRNKGLSTVFVDIDGTLTRQGRLPDNSYSALWKLYKKKINIIPVTGRPAGWCELIARLWPVDGVIGENGAFYFRYQNQKMTRYFAQDSRLQDTNKAKLEVIQDQILQQVPGSAVASDQFTRLFDLAIDFCEDVQPLSQDQILKIKNIFEENGATAKISSIHVNGWFGQFDKLSTCKTYLQKELQMDFANSSTQEKICFIGDSPNDEPMFQSFKSSFGVSNIKDFEKQLKYLPTYVANSPEADGFVEIAEALLL